MHDARDTYAHRFGTFGPGSALPSEEIRRKAVLCVLDTVGCMLAGLRADEAAALRPLPPPRSSAVQLVRFYGYCADVLS